MSKKDNSIPTVMVVGKPRNGKSTAINQIFNVNFQSDATVSSVTQGVITDMAKKDGRILRVIDTPGLGALDIKIDTILPDLRSAVQDLDYIMLYCHSVAPNNTLLEADREIINKLHQSLGKEVWEKCVILLTFSDFALAEFQGKPTKMYKKYLADHIEEFYKFLKTCGSDVKCIRSIFQVDQKEVEARPGEITAIPVGKFFPAEQLMPGVVDKTGSWTDIAFIELMKKTKAERRAAYFYFAYPQKIAILGSIIGAAGGAGIFAGAQYGAVAGTLGGPVGAAAGAVIGAAIGGLGSLSVYYIKEVLVSTISKENSNRKQ